MHYSRADEKLVYKRHTTFEATKKNPEKNLSMLCELKTYRTNCEQSNKNDIVPNGGSLYIE